MLSFASAAGNYFNVIGKIGLIVKQAKAYQTAQLPNLTDVVNGLVAQLNNESDLQALVGSSYIGQLNNVGSTVGGLAQNLAAAVTNRKIFRDNPQISQTLQSLNIVTSIHELIRQMKLQGATVLAQTVTAIPNVTNNPGPHFRGHGTGVVNTSVRRPLDGLVLENAFAETVLLTCTADSYVGGATAGNEAFTITGTGSQGNVFAFDWPLGSNGQTGVSAIDGSVSLGSGNLLTNSGWDDWTSGTPDNWDVQVGVSNVSEETSIVYGTGSALRITGDGSTLVTLAQEFGSDDGTLTVLSPLSQYGVCVFARRDGIAPATGQVVVELVDGNGSVVNDDAGNPNTYTIDLTTLTTNYAACLGQFRTPLIMPSTYFIRLRMPTGNALTTGRSVYFDRMSQGGMKQLAVNCPFYCIHSGDIPFALGDYGTATTSNSRGVGGTLSTFQTLFGQLLPAAFSNEFLLPSSSVPSISDGLIA